MNVSVRGPLSGGATGPGREDEGEPASGRSRAEVLRRPGVSRESARRSLGVCSSGQEQGSGAGGDFSWASLEPPLKRGPCKG